MIEIENASKIYDSTMVVNDVSLTIPPHSICAIMGRSGSGKTTLMRMINRLVTPSAGRILIDGQDITTVPAHELRRRIGYVIQGYGLFPHRSVAENIATVPGLLGWDRKRTAARIDELLTLFKLDPGRFRDRMPHELSGGEQQRVGVARALAAEPNILLMDEPFGALDPVIRNSAQDDLIAIQAKTGTTIVLVTHDMEEAMKLGHRIAVMDKGRVLQCAEPAEIIAHPANAFVAELQGSGDKAFRLLSLQRLEDHVQAGVADGQPLSAGISLREAYSELLWSGRDAAPVEKDSRPLGRISRDAIARLAAQPR